MSARHVAAVLLILAGFLWSDEAPAQCDTGATVMLQVVVYDDWRAVSKAYREITGRRFDRRQRNGFAVYYPSRDLHVLHVARIDNEHSDAVEAWGHELAHAVCGAWHAE